MKKIPTVNLNQVFFHYNPIPQKFQGLLHDITNTLLFSH